MLGGPGGCLCGAMLSFKGFIQSGHVGLDFRQPVEYCCLMPLLGFALTAVQSSLLEKKSPCGLSLSGAHVRLTSEEKRTDIKFKMLQKLHLVVSLRPVP